MAERKKRKQREKSLGRMGSGVNRKKKKEGTVRFRREGKNTSRNRADILNFLFFY